MGEGFDDRRRCKRYGIKGIRGNVRFLADLKLEMYADVRELLRHFIDTLEES